MEIGFNSEPAAKTDCYYCGTPCQTLESLGDHLLKAHSSGAMAGEENGGEQTKKKAVKMRPRHRVPLSPPKPRVKKTPLPHQADALKAIVHGFKKFDRITVVMACGSGKTMVGFWAAKKLSSRNTLIFVPSLALMHQTLQEWRAHDGKGRYLAICSDNTVGDVDGIQVSEEELGCPVTTSAEIVRATLAAPADGNLTVFCTYQSSEVLSDAIPDSFTFDLMILDEAHKTCGLAEAQFSVPLSEQKIAASKRLFMTATPRVVRNRKAGADVYSMDDPVVYGRRVYTLTLDDAIKRGIVSDYKIVVPILEDDDLAVELDSQTKVSSGDEERDGVQAVYYVSLAKAIAHTGAMRVITFHGSVADAKTFSQSAWWASGALPGHFKRFHVNGSMTTDKRETILDQFRGCESGIVSNARCLLEGIDVPSVDMVAFMSPKKSRIDITQAIGRALRKASGKSVGYVMVPSVLDRNGNVIVASREYCDLADVINSLSGQDPMFEKEIRKNAFHSGSGGHRDPSLGGRVKYIGKNIPIHAIQSALSTRLFDSKGVSWDEMFGKLVAYKKKHGVAIPDGDGGPEDIAIRSWCWSQRKRFRDGSMEQREITLLNSVGFVWDKRERRWDIYFSKLKAFHEKHHHANISHLYREDVGLAVFVKLQRQAMKRGDLSEEKIRSLDALGFEWGPQEAAWRSRVCELSDFKKRYGHLHVYPTEYRGLYVWMAQQRMRRSGRMLPPKKVKDLDALGFIWDNKDAAWKTQYNKYIEYKQSKDPSQKESLEYGLRSWTVRNLTDYRQRRLSKEKTALLRTAGFAFSDASPWMEKYHELEKHLEAADYQWSCIKPKQKRWAGIQEKKILSGMLGREKVEKLDALMSKVRHPGD